MSATTQEVRYQLGRDELVAAGWRRRALQPRFVASVAIFAALGIVLVALQGSAAYLGIAFVAYAVLAPLMLYFALHRLVRQCPWLVAPTSLRFGDQGVRIDADGHANEHAWSGFGRWAETPAHYFLYMGRSAAAITIPKRAFDERQRAAFMAYVSKIGA